MKKKEPFAAKLLKYFYGVEELDEYREQELNRINSQTFVLVWIYVILSNLLFLLILLKNPQLAAWAMLWSNTLVFLFILPTYTLRQAQKLDLLATEVVAEDFQAKRTKYKRQIIWGSVGWTIWMMIAFPLVKWWREGGNLLDHLAWILFRPVVLVFPVGGILFGYFLWQMSKSKIRKEEDSQIQAGIDDDEAMTEPEIRKEEDH